MEKRVSKPTKRFIEEIKGAKTTIKKKEPKQKKIKQPIEKVKKQVEKEIEEETNKEIAYDPIAIRDYYDNGNPYWTNHYYIPNDEIDEEYEKLYGDYLDYFEKLPVIFMNGIAQLEVKEEFQKPIKHKISFEKLKQGFYETQGSKSDKTNISNSISFFRKNLPSFKQYEKDDDLSWVVLQDRKLLYEILKYSCEKNSAITTLKGKINAICRIIRLAYKSKNIYKYQKYSFLVSTIGTTQGEIDSQNFLSNLEVKKFLPYDIILNYEIVLLNEFNLMTQKEKLSNKGYDLNQKLLLLSLYTLIRPLRDEPKTLAFTFEMKRDKDYIYFKKDGDVMLLLNKEKKRHEPEERNSTDKAPKLAEILKESYDLYPRPYLFATRNKGKYKKKVVSTLSATLVKIFSKEYPYINVGSSSIRSSYYSYVNSDTISRGFPVSYQLKQEIANDMRTSVEQLDKNYLKIYKFSLPIQQPQPIQPQPEPIEQNLEMPKTNAYYKKLARNKEYISKNKEDIYKKQKEYRQSIPKETQTRNRIIRMLNSDMNYRNHIKQKTIEKYDIKLNNYNKYY